MTVEEIEFFDKLSATWDDDEILSTPERISDILSWLDIKRNDKILDLGTGTGILLPYLVERVGLNGEIVAVDISYGMLSRAIEKYSKFDNVRFVRKDFEEERMEGKFDLILLYSVYPHLHHPERTLRTLLHDNLNTGGRIIVAFPTDEVFINNIHRERKAESDLLPSADDLAERFRSWGLCAKPIACTSSRYIVEICK